MPSDESAGIFPAYPTLLGRPLSEREARLLERARTHAADFATRADEHDRDNSFPSENFEAMQESGYAQMTLPARHGGEDVTLLELCACQEQLAQGCAGTAIGVNMHCFTLGSMLDDLETAPSDRKVRLEYVLGTVGAQKSILCASFSETGTPGSYFLPETKARRAERGWSISGRKAYCSNWPVADMVGAVVHLEDHPDGDDLVAMVIVPKRTPGVSSPGASSWDVLGLRASGSWEVEFKEVFVPAVLMPPPQRAEALFASRSAFGAWFNITVSAVYLGVAQAATDWATRYLQERRPPLEERPLSHMAGLQYQLAEMVALNAASRALIRSSAEDWMAKRWEREEAGVKGGICKYITTNNHVRVVNLAMDIAGGPGLFRRFGLERHYRDVRGGKAHPPSDMLVLEWIAKSQLGIPRDFRPRWG